MDTNITHLLEAARRGDDPAAAQLMRAVYAELRAMAAARLAGEYDNHTLQPTALVHEAWLRLGGDHPPAWRNRAHFFSAAAEAMRRILIDRARRRQRVRHGSGQRPLPLDGFDPPETVDGADHLLAVNEALARFATHEPEGAELVKLRYFAGLTIAESAHVLGLSEATARRRWTYARAWLYRELHAPP